jgi:hypothetical protein
MPPVVFAPGNASGPPSTPNASLPPLRDHLPGHLGNAPSAYARRSFLGASCRQDDLRGRAPGATLLGHPCGVLR